MQPRCIIIKLWLETERSRGAQLLSPTPGNSGKKALHRKSAQTVILKDKKVVGRSPPSDTPTLSLPPAYIGPLSKIVIYAVF